MIEKFKEFLAGKPYKMDEGTVEGWAYQVAVILPSVLREWYDPDFGEVEGKGKDYYETARLKLSALGGFKKKCPEASSILQSLKLLVAFFDNEMCKAGLGKTTKKPPKAQPASVGGGTPTAQKNAPTVLEEGEIIEMHIAKHERNVALRVACIEHFSAQHGGAVVCEACGLSFGERYGEIGEGYIEVHHLSPISQTEGTHTVDPTTDLVPLCANCHAMIHRLMTAEKKNGSNLEGTAALNKLKAVIGGRT